MLSNDNLKNFVLNCIPLDDVYDECENCGRPTLLHKEGNCTRTVEETEYVVNKNWTDLKKRLKPIFKKVKQERQNEAEQNVYLDGIKCLKKKFMVKIPRT